MQVLVDPTLLLESDESTKLVTSMQSSFDPTLLMGTYVSIDHVFNIFISVPSEQGDFLLTLSMLPSNSRMVSFDWSNIFEPLLPSFEPFQIRVEVYSRSIYQRILYEGASAIILSSGIDKCWVLPRLCQLPVSCWLSKEDLMNIFGLFLNFLSF
jgi:hypothetical protein